MTVLKATVKCYDSFAKSIKKSIGQKERKAGVEGNSYINYEYCNHYITPRYSTLTNLVFPSLPFHNVIFWVKKFFPWQLKELLCWKSTGRAARKKKFKKNMSITQANTSAMCASEAKYFATKT